MVSREDRLKAKGAPPPPLPLLPIHRHPSRSSTVVWAVGRFIFLQDTTDSTAKAHRWEAHTDTIRTLDAIAKPPPGASGDSAAGLWVSSGDDKQVIVWEDKVSSWDARFRLTHPKKVTVALFDDAGLVVFADRFGDVYRWSPSTSGESTLLFSHLAIVTAMTFAGSGRFLVSGDNHEKIRVTCYPDAMEIYSFCLGHTAQITALAPHGSGHLVSTGADGMLRLWSLDGESVGCHDAGAPISSLGHTEGSLAASCEDATGGVRLLGISDTFSLTPTRLDTPEPPQAVCVATGAGGVCWVDRRGHLRTQTADGSWGDFFVGEDLPPCIANLSKNAQIWDDMSKQDDAEADDEPGQSGKRGKKRAAPGAAVASAAANKEQEVKD